MSKKSHPLEGLSNIFATLPNTQATPSPAPVEEAAPLPTPEPATPAVPVEPVAKAAVGRPATGKKSDAQYRQSTVYIRKTTSKRVKQALLDAEDGQDFSDLVETLLMDWLNAKR